MEDRIELLDMADEERIRVLLRTLVVEKGSWVVVMKAGPELLPGLFRLITNDSIERVMFPIPPHVLKTPAMVLATGKDGASGDDLAAVLEAAFGIEIPERHEEDIWMLGFEPEDVRPLQDWMAISPLSRN